MATSGTATANFTDSRFKLEARWFATNQNVVGNYTTVKVEVWFYAGVNINANGRTLNIHIDGEHFSMTSNRLQGNKTWIKMGEATKNVYHNSDGTKSFSFGASMTIGSLSGLGNVGSASPSGVGVLNTIPRASTMSNAVSWTAPNNFTVNINRHSSAFTHRVEVHAWHKKHERWVLISSLSGITTSVTFQFNETQNSAIFDCLNTTESTEAAVNIFTYQGSTLIGDTQKRGHVYKPSDKTITVPEFNIGNSVMGNIQNYDNRFNYSVKFVFGTFEKTFNNIQMKYPTFTWTYTDEQSMYAQIPNANRGAGGVYITTYYGAVQVGQPMHTPFIAHVTGSDPAFISSAVSYRDSNTSTVNITGDNQYIIQGYSHLRVEIPSSHRATAVNGATMDRYVISVAGQTTTIPYTTSTITHTFYNINATTNTTLSVQAIDSRGNSTTVYKTVLMLAYTKPTFSATVERRGGFEEETVLKLSGFFSSLYLDGTDMNDLVRVAYRYRESGRSFPATYTNMSVQRSGRDFTVSPVTLHLDSAKSYVVEFMVQDRITTVYATRTVQAGTPILWIDADKKSVGVGQYTDHTNSLEVAGSLYVGGNQVLPLSNGEKAIRIDNQNLNDIVEMGFYYGYNLSNSPSSSHSYWYVIVIQGFSSRYVMQIALGEGGNAKRVYRRELMGSSWSSWHAESEALLDWDLTTTQRSRLTTLAGMTATQAVNLRSLDTNNIIFDYSGTVDRIEIIEVSGSRRSGTPQIIEMTGTFRNSYLYPPAIAFGGMVEDVLYTDVMLTPHYTSITRTGFTAWLRTYNTSQAFGTGTAVAKFIAIGR